MTENKCSYQFSKGQFKNQLCGIPIPLSDTTCKKHKDKKSNSTQNVPVGESKPIVKTNSKSTLKTNSKSTLKTNSKSTLKTNKPCPFIMKNGKRKFLPCKELLVDDLCPIHKPIHIKKWKGTSYYVLSNTDIIFDPDNQLIIGHRKKSGNGFEFVPLHIEETIEIKKKRIELDIE